VDLNTINRIADTGFNHGEVVETAEYLADRIGGRMTNSPAMRTAEKWTQERFTAWGLKKLIGATITDAVLGPLVGGVQAIGPQHVPRRPIPWSPISDPILGRKLSRSRPCQDSSI
jgi:hypothetical protein